MADPVGQILAEVEERPTLQVARPLLAPAARYGLAGEILEAIEPHTESDPAAVLVTVLAAVGALIGSGPHAVADGAEHPARIWPLIVGETSKARKGSSWAQVRRVLAAADPTFTTERVLGGFGSGESVVDAVAGDDADRRVIVLEPEYARILSVQRREGSTLGSLLRQAWDGDRLQARSRARTSVADGAHVVVIGHVTRAELLAKMAESDALGGSLNRFVIVAARRSKLLPTGGSLDDQTVSDFGRNVVYVVREARKVGVVRRTPDAEDYWAELYGRLADDDPGGLLGAAIARDSAQLLRLSVAYALIDGASRIDVAHVVAAEALWSYSRASAAMLFSESTGDTVADLILAELQRAGANGLSRTAIRDLLGRNARKERVDQALAVLEQRGLVTTNTTKSTTRGRPRTVLALQDDINDVTTKMPGGGA